MAAATKIWKGPSLLRRFLVPLEALEPFPGNPRKGDVESTRASYERFGQLKPIVVEVSASAPKIYRIVAGHTQATAAAAAGWTHIAAVANDFGSEEEARAFLLADNRTSELGRMDDELLGAQLAELRSLEGTGYTEEERADLDSRLAALRGSEFRRMDGDFDPTGESPPRLDERSQTSGTFEVPLLLGRDDRADFARVVAILKREWGLGDTTAVVLRAVRDAAAAT